VGRADNFSAIVLTGGRSERMGRSKAAIPFGTTTLLERTIAELRRAFSDIVVAAAPAAIDPFQPAVHDVSVVRDEVAYAGPVGALEGGLRAAAHEIAFACSCDLPMLNADLARELCRMIGDYDAVIPQVAGHRQVLHAAYRKRCAEAFGAMRLSGEPRSRMIVRRVRALILEEDEIRKLGFGLASFFNVNTPADYERALRLAGLG
jgi:molybdenum cofactor guanylyltransferase